MKLRSRSGSPIVFQISIFDEDQDCDRDLNFGDRVHALKSGINKNRDHPYEQHLIF